MKYNFSLDLSNCCPYNQLMICLFTESIFQGYLHIKSPKRKETFLDIKTSFHLEKRSPRTK